MFLLYLKKLKWLLSCKLYHQAVEKQLLNGAQAFLNFYVSHGSIARFLRGGEKYCIKFVDNSLRFSIVK